MKHSIWQAAEDMVGNGEYWIVQGPWLDAEYEDTLDSALEHLQICCEAIVDEYDGGDIIDNIDWTHCKNDRSLAETLLDNTDQDHKWYNDLKQHVFMLTLAGA